MAQATWSRKRYIHGGHVIAAGKTRAAYNSYWTNSRIWAWWHRAMARGGEQRAWHGATLAPAATLAE